MGALLAGCAVVVVGGRSIGHLDVMADRSATSCDCIVRHCEVLKAMIPRFPLN